MPVLEVKDLTARYRLKEGYVQACTGVSFVLEQGESLGVVGESACGKTTMALSLLKLLPDNGEIIGGSVRLQGREIISLSEEEMRRVRWKEISIIFQGAMNAFNPVCTVGRQIVEALRLHEKLTEKEAWKRCRDLFEKVELSPERVKEYPHEFSGGMRQRAMIAMALACNPKVVIGDEPTTALDVIVQTQVLQLLEQLRRETQMGLILITHDLSVIGETCDRVLVMYAGQVVEAGATEAIFTAPAHPYTRALLGALPDIDGERSLSSAIPGNPPNLLNPPGGCRFHERCPCRGVRCGEEVPIFRPVGPEHYCACHYL